jgi:hypothetical protein
MDDLERLWSALLSGNANAIRKTWSDLADDEAEAIADHLKHMLADEAYSAEQKEAARLALEAIQNAG